jgi:hypothetical protein
MKMNGKDVRRHTSMLSEKDMKTPSRTVSDRIFASWRLIMYL